VAVEGVIAAAFGEVVGFEGGAGCAWNCGAVGVLAAEAGFELGSTMPSWKFSVRKVWV